jgi:thioredoxin 1
MSIYHPETYKEFKDVLLKLSKTDKDKQCYLLDFYANWCGPCKDLAKNFDKWVKKYDNLSVIKIDIDNEEFEDFVGDNEITSIPRIFIYRKDRKVADIKGNKVNEIEGVLNDIC